MVRNGTVNSFSSKHSTYISYSSITRGSLRNNSRVLLTPDPHAISHHLGQQSAALVPSVRSHYEVTFFLPRSLSLGARRITLRAQHRTSTDTGQPYTVPRSLGQAPEYGRKLYGHISYSADPAASKVCACKHVLLDDER